MQLTQYLVTKRYADNDVNKTKLFNKGLQKFIELTDLSRSKIQKKNERN